MRWAWGFLFFECETTDVVLIRSQFFAVQFSILFPGSCSQALAKEFKGFMTLRSLRLRWLLASWGTWGFHSLRRTQLFCFHCNVVSCGVCVCVCACACVFHVPAERSKLLGFPINCKMLTVLRLWVGGARGCEISGVGFVCGRDILICDGNRKSSAHQQLLPLPFGATKVRKGKIIVVRKPDRAFHWHTLKTKTNNEHRKTTAAV